MKGKIYKFAEFELWPAESELRKGDSSIKLQEKPLRLLTALLDHPQNLVTRETTPRPRGDGRIPRPYMRSSSFKACGPPFHEFSNCFWTNPAS